MKIAVVTSLNSKIFNDYGRNTLSTYCWDFPLYVYSEDELGGELESLKNYSNKIHYRNIFELDQDCHYFVERNKYRMPYRGVIGEGTLACEVNHVQAKYWRFDAVRFCYKPFSICHLINSENYDIVIWADADIIYSNKLLSDIFISNNLIKEDSLISYFGRNWTHSEMGFIIFNCNHHKTKSYVNVMRKLYITDKIFNLKEWHDSYVWDWVRLNFEKEFEIETYNLSNIGDINEESPMANSIMHDYFDHLIGPDSKNKLHSIWWKIEERNIKMPGRF